MTERVMFKEILQFFSQYNNWEEIEYLFEKLSAFFTEHYPESILVGLSAPKDQELTDKKIRVTWNKDALTERDRGTIFHLMETKGTPYISQQEFVREEGEGTQYFLAHIGEEESQIIFLCLRLKNTDDISAFLTSFLSFARNTGDQIQRWKGLSKQSSLIFVDDVTGLYNQRKLHKDLFGLIHRYERSGENFALLFIDIDHFKNVNDNYGHLIGTKLLSDLGKVLRRILRDTDFIYRYGGDEFVAIIPDASTNDARLIGERILKTVRDEHFYVEEHEHPFRISISVGIASFPRDAKDGKEVLELADRMMYRAKNRGRGCVCLAADFYSDS